MRKCACLPTGCANRSRELDEQAQAALCRPSRRGGARLLRVIEGDAGSDQAVLKNRLMVTDREAEVLLWIARGKSNRDIAEIFSLSPRTVNKHLEQIFTKLGVENRTSAAALAVRTLGIR